MEHRDDRRTRPDTETASEGKAAPAARPRIASRALFGTGRELVIEHAVEDYLLRITRKNKLILTK